MRKLYGNIPPTDPRFLSLTMEQIELDLVHNWIDQQQKNGSPEYFADDSYEDYDKETSETDAVLSSHSVPVHKKVNPPAVAPSETPRYVEEEWEDVD